MKKKIALVTGASGGIGGACAEKLAREGYTCLLYTSMRPLGLKDGRMIYEAQIGVGDQPRLLWYRFECEYKGEHVVLGAPGDHTGCGEGVMGSEESFQLTVYDAAYDTPAWMRDGVMYQIMVDRFCHGEGTDALMHAKDGQNIILHEDWNEMPFLNIAENGDNFAMSLIHIFMESTSFIKASKLLKYRMKASEKVIWTERGLSSQQR